MTTTRALLLCAWAVLASVSIASAQSLAQGVTEFTVNGLKVLVKQRPAGQTVAVGLYVRGGSRNITDANAGVETLTLDLATEASAKFPRELLRRELARTASSLTYGVNYDYSALALHTTRPHFDRGWEIFVDSALHPRLTAEDFELVKQRSLSSLADDQDSPDSMLSLLQADVAYAGHPYQNQPRGTLASVRRLTLDDVRAYHRRIMQTSGLLLVVVGDLDPQEVQRKAAAAFAALPVGVYQAPAPPALVFTTPTLTVTARDLPTNYIQGTYAAPPLTSPDIYPMRVATAILSNRVFEEVRIKRNLSYAPNATLNDQGANIGGIYVTAVDANQTVRLMLEEIATLQSQDVDAAEIRGTAQSFLTSHYLDQETNSAQAGALARAELISGGWRTTEDLLDRLRAVTPQDVRRVAITYMRNLQFVVLGNPLKIDKQLFTRPLGR